MAKPIKSHIVHSENLYQPAQLPHCLISLNFAVYSNSREHGGIVVRATHSGARGRGFDPHSGRRVVSLPPQKVLVIPRKGWLRLDTTKKLFTGMLSKKQNRTKQMGSF